MIFVPEINLNKSCGYNCCGILDNFTITKLFLLDKAADCVYHGGYN